MIRSSFSICLIRSVSGSADGTVGVKFATFGGTTLSTSGADEVGDGILVGTGFSEGEEGTSADSLTGRDLTSPVAGWLFSLGESPCRSSLQSETDEVGDVGGGGAFPFGGTNAWSLSISFLLSSAILSARLKGGVADDHF